MFYWIYTFHLLLFAIALCAAFAAWKGDPPERWGAFANLTVAVVDFALSRLLPTSAYASATLVVDLLTATIFLVLALRYASLWLGVAMLLLAAQFSLHAFYFVTERPADLLWATVNNTVSWGVVWVIVVGVAMSWRRRTRAAAELLPTFAADGG